MSIEQLKKFLDRSKPPEEFREPYMAGRDCGLYGPDDKNCHFGWFSTQARTTAWERGKADGEAERNRT